MKNKIENILLVLICILLPWMIYGNISEALINMSLADAVFVLTGIYLLIEQLVEIYCWKRKGKEKPVLLSKRTLFAAGYFLLLLLSLVISHFAGKRDPKLETVSRMALVLEIIKTLVVAGYFFVSSIMVKDEKRYRLVLHTMVFGSLPVAAVGFLAYIYNILDKPFFLKQFEIRTNLRFLGSFQDPNLCAFYFLMVFYLGLYLFKEAKSRIIAWAMGITSIISLVVIILTMSRGAWLALGSSFVVFLILQLRNLRKETILLAIVMLVAIFSMIQLDLRYLDGDLTYRVIGRIESALYQGSDVDRIRLSKAALKMGNEHPIFGSGKGNFELNVHLYLEEDEQFPNELIPHNTLLSFYAQQGIMGLCIFLMLPAYVFYHIIKKKTVGSPYHQTLFLAWAIQSLTINIENIRFVWFFAGLIFSWVLLESENSYEITLVKNRKWFLAACSIFTLIFLAGYYDTARKLPLNIYIYNGKVTERTIDIKEPGVYNLTFDIHTDTKLHSVEIYEQDRLIDTLSFKSAYGYVNHPIKVANNLSIKFISGEDGWMRVSDAHLNSRDSVRSLQDYIFLPRFLEDFLDEKKLLVYNSTSKVTHAKVDKGEDEFSPIDIIGARVIKYSNLTTVMEFDAVCKEKMESLYQLDLRLEFDSLSSLLANETQRNVYSQRFSLSPRTEQWEAGKDYTTKTNRLLWTDDFELFGRFYDYTNKVYNQETFFPIPYELTYEEQDIKELGTEEWINIRYGKDKEGSIRITNNGWVETKRYNLEPGVYNIVFKAQGSYFDGEFSKLRIRDSYLNEIDSFFVDGEMRTYKVKYLVEQKQEGVSFLLELVNYKSGEGGNRGLLVEQGYEVVGE